MEIVWEHREITRVSGYAVTGYKSMEPRNRSKLDRFYTFSSKRQLDGSKKRNFIDEGRLFFSSSRPTFRSWRIKPSNERNYYFKSSSSTGGGGGGEIVDTPRLTIDERNVYHSVLFPLEIKLSPRRSKVIRAIANSREFYTLPLVLISG